MSKTQSKVDAALIKQELDDLDRKTFKKEPETFQPNILPEDSKEFSVDKSGEDPAYDSDTSYEETTVPPPPQYGVTTLPLGGASSQQSAPLTRSTETTDEEAPRSGVIPVAQAVQGDDAKGHESWWNDLHKRTVCLFLIILLLLAAVVGLAVGLAQKDDSGNNTKTDRSVTPQEAPKLPGTWNQLGETVEGVKKPDKFGKSLSLSKDGLVFAAGADDDTNEGGLFAGSVRVFQYVPGEEREGTWAQLGQDLEGVAEDDSAGISTAVNGDGTVVAVGAYRHSPPGVDCCGAGHVRVFGWIFGEWVQLGQSLDGEAKADRFGSSCALSEDGTILAIGGHNNDVQGDRKNAGHVRVFEFVGGNWTQIGSDVDGVASNDKTGDRRVRLSDDGKLLVVGGNSHDGNGKDAGHVRVFERSMDNEWIQVGSSIEGEGAGDKFGATFDISGDGRILAVGAAGNDGNGENSGHARTFTFSPELGDWVQFGADLDGEAANDEFGRDVALNTDGTVLVVSAKYNAEAYVDAGHVRIFRWVNGEWIQVGDDIDGTRRDAEFGSAVDISGDGTIVAASAPESRNGAGDVFVFQLEE